MPPALTRMRWHTRSSMLALAMALALSLVLLALRDRVSTANVALLYLLPVLTGATLGGLVSGVLAAVACATAFDVLFIKPYGTLSVASGQDLLTLVLYLGTGALVAELSAHARARADEAAKRAATNALLYDLSGVFLASDLNGVLEGLVERLGRAFALRACGVWLLGERGSLQSRAHWGVPLTVAGTSDERQISAAATWACTQGETISLSLAGPGHDYPRRDLAPGTEQDEPALDPGETIVFVPLHTGLAGERAPGPGLLVLSRPVEAPLTAEEIRLLATFATQAGLAVDRARLAEESAAAAILRESDRAKSALLSNVSHDLRTPLTTIHGAAESLLQQDLALDEPTRQELLTSIRDEADRLAALVGNLLNLSRLEAGALIPERHLYDLAEIAGGVLTRLRPHLARHVVHADFEHGVPLALVDYTLLEQVLVNLVENAAKYAPPATAITVGLRSADGRLILSVADQGPGIPTAEREHAFERFYRLSGGSSRPVHGTGLGLAICRAVVEAHGGQIWIEDTVGGGTTVCIALRIPESPEGADR